MKRKIITYPNPILRKKAEPVTEFDDKLEELVKDMMETMFDAPGAGLAANQIGVSKQIIVVNTSEPVEEGEEEKKEAMALINPQILDGEGEQVDVEGCLSVREYTSKVKRLKKITVRAQDINGESEDFEAEDFFARVIQHECDHLEGKLFIDRISSLKRTLYKKRLKKILAQDEAEKKS